MWVYVSVFEYMCVVACVYMCVCVSVVCACVRACVCTCLCMRVWSGVGYRGEDTPKRE